MATVHSIRQRPVKIQNDILFELLSYHGDNKKLAKLWVDRLGDLDARDFADALLKEVDTHQKKWASKNK
jgi:hypothetical protein